MKVARVYASRGWAIVPLYDVTSGACSCGKPECKSAGKHPRLNEWQRQATADVETVEQWIADYPTANVGIATGAPSGFFCLDVDGDRGRASLAALGELPVTVEAQTGSGGTHYLFKLPDFDFANSASEVAPGLDIRTTGGQIVVAPSVSLKGAYRWIRPPFGATPIADAPAWLLERLRPRVATAAPVERGEFPPASAEVLTQAREALDSLGPAVSGEGGDDKTFRAMAMLRHDFALTFEEAWAPAWEWNASNAPPWSDEDLAAKLRGGERYGTGEYGSKRKADVLQRANKLIADWRESGTGEYGFEALAKQLRALAIGVDPVVKATIEANWNTATGLSAKQLALPGARVESERDEGEGIKVTPKVHMMANAATAKISDRVFHRGGMLCEVVKNNNAVIFDLATARIQDLMSEACEWYRDGEKGKEVVAPPISVAEILRQRRKHEGVRELDGVTTSPIFLADGSILQAQGYNAQARVYLEPDVTVVVPDAPTLDDARASVRAFYGLLSDFKFVERADFSSWLATLLTPLVKAATGNAAAPMLCISASTPGSGKTLLAKVMAQIVTGRALETASYSREPAELEKRVTSIVLAASPLGVFDDLNGRFGPDEVLDRLLTSAVWKNRLLGGNNIPALPNVPTWIATGNNIEPSGATVRRVLVCRIEVDTPNPQERTKFRIRNLEEHAREYRAHYLSHALTILRAFHLAKRPADELAEWGSFETWSALVRGALVWTGLPDPFLTQRRAASTMNDAEHEAHDFWLSVIEGAIDGTPSAIVDLANRSNLRGVLGAREDINPFTLRGFIQRFIDRPRNGKRIRREIDVKRQQTRYSVEAVT